MAKAKRRGKGSHGEPWLRSQAGTYYVTIDGKKTNLRTSDKAEAHRNLRELQGKVEADPCVSTIIDKFIEWSEEQVQRKLQKPRTLETNARYLVGTWSKEDGRKLTDGFKDFIGNTLVSDLRTKDVKDWLEVRYPDVSQNTRAGVVKAVERVFSWATNSRDELPTALVEKNPVSGMKVPPYVPRKAWLSAAQWDRIAAEFAPDDSLSDLLRAVHLTGCTPHRHPGAVFGYVLEGELEFKVAGQPLRTLKTGETFYEPTMILHEVSRNPSDKTKTRILAVIVHPRDAKQLVIPEPQPQGK